MINAARWWLFHRIIAIGWAVCPEPQRSDLQRRMTFNAWAAHSLKSENQPVRIAE